MMSSCRFTIDNSMSVGLRSRASDCPRLGEHDHCDHKTSVFPRLRVVVHWKTPLELARSVTETMGETLPDLGQELCHYEVPTNRWGIDIPGAGTETVR